MWRRMSHGCSPLKEGSQRSEIQLCNQYVGGLHEVTRRVQCNQTLSTEQSRLVANLPPGAVASC